MATIGSARVTTPACPTCGHEPRTRADAVRQRDDLAIDWLVLDPSSGDIVERRYCRACLPHGPIADLACSRCGDGPLLSGPLASAVATGRLPPALRRWLLRRHWQTEPQLDCCGPG